MPPFFYIPSLLDQPSFVLFSLCCLFFKSVVLKLSNHAPTSRAVQYSVIIYKGYDDVAAAASIRHVSQDTRRGAIENFKGLTAQFSLTLDPPTHHPSARDG